jgi:hypothetical protein
MVYPALLPLMRTPQLPVVDCTDAPADLNGLVRFAERRNLVCARVPSHFKRSLRTAVLNLQSEVVPLLQSSASGGGGSLVCEVETEINLLPVCEDKKRTCAACVL